MLETTLDNGLKVIVEENHAAPVVAAQVWVRVGSADEQPEEAGLAHVHEHMLFKGTERRKVGEIAADVEAAGGDINAFTSFDQTVYHVTIASRELDVALDILSDAVQHSSFDAEELERELEVVLEELRRGKDTPSRVASEMLFETAFRKHPYGRPIIGFEENVRSFTREMILKFYKRWYQPKNMCLVVAGDVDPAEVVKKAEKLFEADRNSDDNPERPRTPEPPQTDLRIAIKAHDTQETHLSVAWQGTPLSHEDTAALDVLSVLMGTGESSRLYRKVKRELELVNDCYAYCYTPQDAGIFVVGAQIHGPNIKEPLAALLEETWRLRFEAPTAEEVEKAKTIILSDAIYGKETVQGVARKLGYFELVGGGVEFEPKYYDQIRTVTPLEVRQVAEKYLNMEHLTLSALLPEAHKGALTDKMVKAVLKDVKKRVEEEFHSPRIEPGNLGVTEVKLKNGATLLIQEDNAVPLVSVRAAGRGGILCESEKDSGVTHLLGELLVRGTEKYSAENLISEIDGMAGGVSGVSGRNSLGLRGDFLRETWERGFELFSSCLLEPVFPEDEIAKEKKNQIEDIIARQDRLSAVAFEHFQRELYGDHPYGRSGLGTETSVGSLNRDDVLRHFRTQLRPDELVLSVVGAVDVAHTVRMFEKRLGQASAHADAGRFEMPPEPARPTAPRTHHVHRDKEQAHLVLGFPGVTLFDKRRWALEVMSSVLSGQSGRLFLELRDRQSLAYSIGGFSLEGLAPGYFAIYIGTAPEKLEVAERGIREQLDLLRDEKIKPEELSRAQRFLVGSHDISLQRASSRSGSMALSAAYGMGYDHYAEYPGLIEAVTIDDVQKVANEIIDYEAAVRSIVASTPAPK